MKKENIQKVNLKCNIINVYFKMNNSIPLLLTNKCLIYLLLQYLRFQNSKRNTMTLFIFRDIHIFVILKIVIKEILDLFETPPVNKNYLNRFHEMYMQL